MKLRNKKTGEIGELYYYPEKEYCFTVATEDPADMMIYKTIGGIWYDWEDVEDINVTNIPLIKDEKIRKAVRAWAEAQGLTEVYLSSNGYEIYGGDDDWVIQFEGEPFPFADKNRTYTIDELCREEEE